MKEQNEKEQEKTKDKDKTKTKIKSKRKRVNGEKRFYILTALGCAAALTAIITVAVAVSRNAEKDVTLDSGNDQTQTTPGDEQVDAPNDNDDEQVVVTPQGMVSPLETVSILNEYGFYHNQTVNSYYMHEGVDFAAEAGTAVLAVESGVIESIYKGDLLLGTEIVVDHGDGLKSLYRFVTEVDGLAVGDSVEKGEQIATVAEANGNEYKDGAHLHFEVYKNDAVVDPNVYLTLQEK